MWKSQTKGSQGAGSKRRQPKVIVATVNKKRLIICPQNDWTHSPLTSCKLKSLLMFDVVNKSWLVDPQQRRNHLQGYVHLTVAWLSQTSLLYTNRGGFRKKWQLFTCTRKLSSTCSEGFARKHGLLLSVSIDNYTCIICRQDGRRPCLFLSAENDMDPLQHLTATGEMLIELLRSCVFTRNTYDGQRGYKGHVQPMWRICSWWLGRISSR